MAGLRGIIIPLPTTFTSSGDVDHEATQELIRFYIKAGVHGLFILGTFGHGPALSPEERKELASVTLKEVGGKIPAILHVGTADTPTTVKLAKDGAEKGATALAIIPPYYFEHNDDEVLAHFKTVYEAVRYPLFIYNNAVNSGYRMTAAWAARLTKEVPDICGIKMSFIPMDQQLAFVRALPPSCAVFSGNAGSLMPGCLWGVAGSIHPTTVAIPETLVKLWNAIEERNLELAVDLQKKVVDFNATVGGLCNQYGRTPLRESLKMRGLPIRSFPRWPTREMPDADMKKLEAAIKAVV